jgi:hypothetical protein
VTHPVAAATAGPLAEVVCAVGLAAGLAWIAWRFGPTLARLAGFCSLWVAWACGSQAGYGYCVAFLLLGIVAWGAGTVWYAKRRGRWPSAISERLLARVLGRRSPLRPDEPETDGSVIPLRHP